MLGKLMRAVSLVLFAWFVFMIGSVIYAATRRREAVPQDPAADEVDLVATFGPLRMARASGLPGGCQL